MFFWPILGVCTCFHRLTTMKRRVDRSPRLPWLWGFQRNGNGISRSRASAANVVQAGPRSTRLSIRKQNHNLRSISTLLQFLNSPPAGGELAGGVYRPLTMSSATKIDPFVPAKEQGGQFWWRLGIVRREHKLGRPGGVRSH